MNHNEQWKILSARIQGLMNAMQLHTQYLIVRSSDSLGRGNELRNQFENVLDDLGVYVTEYQQSLPPEVLNVINDFINTRGDVIRLTVGTPDIRQERLWLVSIIFASLETEISYILSDNQEFMRKKSELAFSHLRRLIVVDEETRQKWGAAFEAGEVRCEKLGAVHLLLHGIWAFKVDAEGARTDLVFQEPAGDLENENRFVDGFVLTEWKKAGANDNPTTLFEQARVQAELYTEGALSGSELTSYRYLVVVSEKQVEVPDDFRVRDVVYRHINIPVAPLTPSRASRAQAKADVTTHI